MGFNSKKMSKPRDYYQPEKDYDSDDEENEESGDDDNEDYVSDDNSRR